MVLLARLLIAADVVLADVYLVSFKVTPTRVLAVALVLLVLVLAPAARHALPSTRRLMAVALALVGYKFVLDATLHYDGTLDALTQLLKEVFVVLTLPVFERIGARRIAVPATLLVVSVPAIALGAMQILDPGANLEDLLPANPVVFTAGTASEYLASTGRIVGTYNIAIGFAFLLGVLCIVLWSQGMVRGRGPARVAAAAAAVALFGLAVHTQTRSAIYGIVPAMLVAYLLVAPASARKLALGLGCLLAVVAGTSAFEAFVTARAERNALALDANTYYKLTANVYGTYAALARNPLFGVPVDRDVDVWDHRSGAERERRNAELLAEGRRALGPLFGDTGHQGLVATNHNLFGFYLRYYGLVGFALLLATLYLYHRKAMAKRDLADRYLLMALLAFFVQFSLLHNTALLTSILMWALLAHGDEGEVVAAATEPAAPRRTPAGASPPGPLADPVTDPATGPVTDPVIGAGAGASPTAGTARGDRPPRLGGTGPARS